MIQKNWMILGILTGFLLLIISPVSAYTTLYTNTIAGGSWGTGGAADTNSMRVNDVAGFTGTSKIEIVGQGYKYDNGTRSHPTRISQGGTYYGNATVSWNWVTMESYSSKYTYTVEILDFNKKALTGVQTFTFTDVPPESFYPCYVSNSPSVNLPSTTVGNLISASGTATVNGTHTMYGGVPGNTVTFHVSEVGNFTNKLSGVTVTVSSGVSGTTDGTGTVALNIFPPASNLTYGATKTGYADISGWVLGALGTTGGDEYFTMVPSTRIGNITLYAVTKDAADPSSTVTGTTISIKNLTGSWYNASYPSGNAVLTGTGTPLSDPLYVGETVTICGSGTGYAESCSNLVIPYDRYLHRIYLTKTTETPTNGNWNLLVSVVRNLDNQPICSALVTVTTGVSGVGIFESGTDCTTGTASFLNISASTSAMINVVAQGYQSGSAFTPVVPNTTQHITIELVQIGQTPVATPIAPTATTTYSSPGSAQGVPVPTDANGNPITTSQDMGFWSIWELAKMLPTWIKMIAGMVTLALMWGFIYWSQGGKYRKSRMWKGGK